jgi:hypothetical protein
MPERALRMGHGALVVYRKHARHLTRVDALEACRRAARWCSRFGRDFRYLATNRKLKTTNLGIVRAGLCRAWAERETQAIVRAQNPASSSSEVWPNGSDESAAQNPMHPGNVYRVSTCTWCELFHTGLRRKRQMSSAVSGLRLPYVSDQVRGDQSRCSLTSNMPCLAQEPARAPMICERWVSVS